MNLRRLSLLSVLGLALALAGCGNYKLTSANLDKVHNGMSKKEVEALLGKPNRIETGETLGIRSSTYTYSKKDAEVKIVFFNDHLMLKNGTFQ